MSKAKKRDRAKAKTRDQNNKRAKKTYFRKTADTPRERRYLVSLEGGVVSDGSYGFVAKGFVAVFATSEKEALENARGALTVIDEAGSLLPDEGLDLVPTKARIAGFKGPVCELPPKKSEALRGLDPALAGVVIDEKAKATS